MLLSLFISLLWIIPVFVWLFYYFSIFAWGVLVGICVGGLFFGLYIQYRKAKLPFLSFSSDIFQQLQLRGLEGFRKQVSSYIPSLVDYQVFVFSQNEVTTFPKSNLSLTKIDRQHLEYYIHRSLHAPLKIEQYHTFMLYMPQDYACYAYAYTIPLLNKRILIFTYSEIGTFNNIKENLNIINDMFLMSCFLEGLADGKQNVVPLLYETLWDSPYPIALSNASGALSVGNDSLYQMFQGDVPNFIDLIGREVFLLLLDGKRIGQSFLHQGKRYRVEAYPVTNKNFLITKCLFVFFDDQLDSKRDSLDEGNTLKRFTSGSAIVGAAMFTQEGLILYSNEAFMKSLDVFKVREATQKNIFELFELTIEQYQNIVSKVLQGNEQQMTLASKDNDQEFQTLFKGIVFGDQTIIEVVLEDNTIYHDNLTYLDKETEILYEELKTARSIQEHILTLPTIYRPGLYINTLYKPAHQLSGDFFTVIPFKDDKLGVLMADVSGHGISASLITAALKILIEFVPDDADSLPKIMAYFNTYLAEIIPEGSFVTLFYGIIDYKEGTLQYINSGHPFPLLEDCDKNEVKILEGMGFPLGGLLNVSFDELVYTIQLPEKSRLLLYTDGLLQYMSGTMKEKLLEMGHMIDNNRHLNNQSLLDTIYTSLSSRVSPLADDDVSMMMVSFDKNHTLSHRLNITSSLLQVDIVIQEIGTYIKKTAELNDAQYWKVQTCFYEALLNAVVHGNKYNTQKKVYIEFKIIPDSLIILRIRDEGKGFDYNNLPDPFDPENILKDFGRGVQMVKTLADEIKFNKEGNEITIFIKYNKEV